MNFADAMKQMLYGQSVYRSRWVNRHNEEPYIHESETVILDEDGDRWYPNATDIEANDWEIRGRSLGEVIHQLANYKSIRRKSWLKRELWQLSVARGVIVSAQGVVVELAKQDIEADDWVLVDEAQT